MGSQLVQPVRRVNYGDAVVDQFPLYDDADGYTKVTGGAFTTSVWLNGVVDATSVTVTEIGTSGEYKVSFTPGSIGLWTVEIRNDAEQQTWKGQYDVQSDGAVAGQEFHDVVRDARGNGIPYVLVEALEAGTATVLASTTTAFDGSYSFELTGNLQSNPLLDLRFSGTNIQTLVKEGVRLA